MTNITRFSELYPDVWIRPGDLKGQTHTREIVATAVEELYNARSGEKEPKAILDFGGAKRLILNKTNAKFLQDRSEIDIIRELVGWTVVFKPGRANNGKETIIITDVFKKLDTEETAVDESPEVVTLTPEQAAEIYPPLFEDESP